MLVRIRLLAGRRTLGRRPLIASTAAALVLVGGGATAVALSPSADEQDSARALALRLEADPAAADDVETEAPAVTVPEDAEWSMRTPDASAEAAPTPDPREVRAAARAAERADLAEQEAAQQRAAEQQAAQQQQRAAEQEAAQQQPAAQPEATQQQEAAPRTQRAEQPAAVADGSERGVLTSMLNSYRASNGLAPLSRDGALDQAAQQWAQWMAQNQSLQHSDYVNGAVQRGSGWSSGSEIIVRYRGGSGLPSGEITSFMHNWWRGSAVHNANMLKSGFTHVGTGYAMGPGGPYAVHIFGG